MIGRKLTVVIVVGSALLVLLPPTPAISDPASASAPAASAADAENVEVVGHIGGAAYAVAVRGNHAYVGEGPALVILDISDPASPTALGRTAPFPDIVEDVYVSGDYAYVADGADGNLRVVDVSDPTAPVEAGSWSSQGYVYGAAVTGGYAYLADASLGLWVLDVSNPIAPVARGRCETPGNAYDVAVVWPYAYVADMYRGLTVVDVSTPTSPTPVGFYDTPGYAYDVAVVGDYAYVADFRGGLRVVDVSTPTDPTEVGFYDKPYYVYAVVIAWPYAYVADGSSGLRVVDVSDPTAPTELAYCNTLDARGVAVAGDHAYVADKDSLLVLDVSVPSDPAEVGSYDTPVTANGVAVADGYAYIADVNGVEVVDVSNPARPAGVGSRDTEGSIYDVAVAGDYAYLAGGSLRIVYVVDKGALPIFSSCNTPGNAMGVTVVGDYAYVADQTRGLTVEDVSNRTDPTCEVGSCDTPGYAYGVTVVGDYAYVADYYEGLRVLDISTPTDPTEVGSCDTPGSAYDVAVVEDHAYVADGYGGLRVLDISVPSSPTEVGYCDTPGRALGVAATGDYAYVANENGGLRVVDVSAPISPMEVGYYDMLGYASDVVVAGDYAYVAAGDSGLFILYFSGTSSDPPAEVTVSGPATGVVDTAQVFTAIVSPVTAARPITYVWQATGQSAKTHVGGRSDAVSFAWHTAGTKTLTVTATNAEGTVSDTHVISIGPPVPVEGVAINCPPTGTVNTTYSCSATVSPITATQPITYTWQVAGQSPVTHVDGPSVTDSFAWAAPGTQAITVTASNAWGSVHANHTIVISEPDTGDAYEPDDTCAQARILTADGTVQKHTFHKHADEDWVRFTVVSGTTYVVQATSTGLLADTALELYDTCAAPPLPPGDLDLGPGARLRWTASQDTTYYLRVTNHIPADYGPQASYDLSVRAASPVGAAIVVAGRNDGGTLHPNINVAANRAARVFLDAGLSRAHLRYLNSDSHPGGGLTPDAEATSANLQHAIETWAADKVGPGQQLYLYLVDHGGQDVFLTDGRNGDTTSAADLDDWLATLEAATECPVNVILEACRSGSFIDDSVDELIDDISKGGRVVIASTNATRNAYALPGRGAYFSDSFFTALNVGTDLWTAFRAGQQAVAAHGLWQTPWLDDDGDAMPHVYDPDDGREARRRGLAGLGCSGIAPHVETVSGPAEIVDGRGTVRARVVDDLGVDFVWALVYPPSFEEPEPSDEETLKLTLDSFVLEDHDGDGEYEGSYSGFTEVGEYRIVVYAKDGDGNLALPRIVMVRAGRQVYLPLICRES